MATRVLFLAPYVKQYRVPFFDGLHSRLREDGVELRVLYGNPNTAHAARKDNVHLPASYGKNSRSFWIADRMILHTAWREIYQADLVITPNENKMLVNPLLIAARQLGKRVAFWGKGDFERTSFLRPSEWLRFKVCSAVDWWFPYTHRTAQNLRRSGVRCGITPIANAVDTAELRSHLASISTDCVKDARLRLGLGGGPVGIFCGNLSANKRLPFLFAAADRIRRKIPDFHLIVVGNGPQQQQVELIAARERFIRYVGPRVGREKALLLSVADVFLLPGAVGLAILDGFVAGLPLLTTELQDHGPEMGYLSHNTNGIIIAHDVQSYADETIALLRDPERLAKLRTGAIDSGFQYSIENMIENFRAGILECLTTKCSYLAPVRGEA